jgi:fructokinase
MNGDPVFAGVEIGGTKVIALVGRGRTILDRVQMPTTSPAETLPRINACLARWDAVHHPAALGIGSFGPIDVDQDSVGHGHMLATPKPGWAGADVLGDVVKGLALPHALHTDVTTAALAEARWGAAQGLHDFIYVTIGTGIGMGIIVNGRPVTGTMHPEAGHMRVPRLPGDDFPGVCPFHGNACVEGLAAGPAIQARFSQTAADAAADDPRWLPVIDALAEAMTNLFLTLAPQRILIGGGVAVGQPHLLPAIRAGVVAKVAGYLPTINRASIAERLQRAGLGADAGPLGCLALAADALDGGATLS